MLVNDYYDHNNNLQYTEISAAFVSDTIDDRYKCINNNQTNFCVLGNVIGSNNIRCI